MGIKDDLEDLEEILRNPKVVPFRGHVREGTFLRKKLVRFTNHIFLFPVAIQPDLSQPVEVFHNGLGPLTVDEEFELRLVGPGKKNVVAIFRDEVRSDDVIQARYVAARVE